MLLSAVVLVLSGCASPVVADEAGSEALLVFKSRGSKQCGTDGQSPQLMAGELASAGITVRRLACGDDGRMRIALCGAADGRLNIFEIARSREQAALAIGFAPLPAGARETACR